MSFRTTVWLAALSGTIAAESLILYYLWRRNKNVMERLQNELEKIRVSLFSLQLKLEAQAQQSVGTEDSRQIVLKSLPLGNFGASEAIQNPSPEPRETVSRVTSLTSDSEYLSAAEEWSPSFSGPQLSLSAYGDVIEAEEATPEILNVRELVMKLTCSCCLIFGDGWKL
uniref:Uncharacterized protein n=1 Tax=Acrobeloides nanus TaxID=290746 RepID=A0A914CZW3_9BILA